MASANIEHLRPAQLVARRVIEARKALGWSQADLARELDRLGYSKSRTTLTKLESGRHRNVTVDDLLALSAALDVHPIDLLLPTDDDETVAITPRVRPPAWAAREWISGDRELPMLPDTDYRRMPEAELVADIKRWLTRGMGPVAKALSEHVLEARARQMAADLRGGPESSAAYRRAKRELEQEES